MVGKRLGNDDVIDFPQVLNWHRWGGMPLLIEPGKAIDLGASEPGIEEESLVGDGDFPGGVLIEALKGDHGLVSSYLGNVFLHFGINVV